MTENVIQPENDANKRTITLRGAIFIGIGSMVGAGTLAIFVLVTIARIRMAEETKASREILYLALIATSLAILLLAWYTLQTAPEIFAILVVIIILAWIVEAVRRWYSKREFRSVA